MSQRKNLLHEKSMILFAMKENQLKSRYGGQISRRQILFPLTSYDAQPKIHRAVYCGKTLRLPLAVSEDE